MDWPTRLQQELDRHRQAILAFAADLVRIPSENPPGRAYPECLDRVARELDRLGLAHQRLEVPGFPDHPRANLLAFTGDGGPTLYFHGHYDVVPAQRPDQFQPRVRDGYLEGRGSADMKAGLAAMIYAAWLLKTSGAPLQGRVGLCVVADEETGGQGGSAYLTEAGLLGRDGIAMLTPEPTSGVVWNANRGAVTLRITVLGRPAHVGLQHQGVNAFEHMVEAVRELQVLKAEVEQRRSGFRIEPAEAARSILMLGGRVEGGTNFNVVPGRCSFTVERRFNPEEDHATEKARLFEVLERLRGRGLRLEVEVLQDTISSGVTTDQPAARILADTIAQVQGRRPAFEMCPGSLEIRWYARQGIPAFAYGPGLLEVAHGPEERVEVEDVYRHALVYALYGLRMLGGDRG
jgi:acetylornithine deacetylase/succinyl-diaminopimelate desuccinylase family protein